MATAKKIPAEMFVTLKRNTAWDGTKSVDDAPLGFMHPYEPTTKGFAKKRSTQMHWAYGSVYIPGNDLDDYHSGTSYYSFEERHDGVWVKPHEVIWNRGHREFNPKPDPVRLPQHLQPMVIKNEPLEGFEIVRAISRYKGNKVWRVQDPRGFQLEISTACFEDILMEGSVIKGAIQGKLVWRTGKLLEYAK